jgi:ABC-type uncharacterized transport system substrate-binding protein
MTGLTSTHTELSAKRIQLLKEGFPATRRIGVLYFLAPSAAGVSEQLAETERAAKVLGLALAAEESSRVEDFGRAFASMQKLRPDALIVIENPMFFTNRVRLTELAAAMRIPAIYNVSEYVQALRAHELRRELCRPGQARRRLCGEDCQWRQAG